MGKVEPEGTTLGGKLTFDLARMKGRRVYFDTNVFVYFLDRNPKYFSVVVPLMDAAATGDILAWTGDAAIAETMVQPYRVDDPALLARCKGFFATEGFLRILSHDAQAFDLAAQLRAKRGLKFIDALHCATALLGTCSFWVTNDAGIQSDDALEVIQLKDWL